MACENLLIGFYIISLFFVCTISLSISYIKTGYLYIFKGQNYFLLKYFLLHGVGYYTYLLRNSLGLGWYTHSDALLEKGLGISFFACVIFQICYYFSNKYIKVRQQPFSYLKFKKIFNSYKTKWFILIVGIVSACMLLWALMGNVPILIPNYHDSARASVGKGLGGVEALYRGLVSLSLLFYIYCFKNRKFNKFFCFFLTIMISLYLLNMDRGGLLIYLLSVGFVYYLCISKFTLKQCIISFLSIILIAGSMGAMRLKNGNFNDLQLIGAYIFTEASVEFDNYIEVFNMVENKGELYGSTLVPIITLPVPRAVMPDKDKYLTAGNYFKEYHNHSHIRVGERISYIGELYLNWNIAGVIIGMMAMGVLLSVCDRKCDYNSIISIYLYIQFVNFFSGFVAGDIATAFIGFFMNNVLVIFFIFGIKWISDIRKHNYEKNLC